MFNYTPAQREIFFTNKYKYGIYPKGRRLGATQGGAQALLEYANAGKRVLWGDVILANIRRYYERYFYPAIKKAGLETHFDKQDLVLKVGKGFIDFRSADKPEKWEGFGYDIIFLNEAGIILNNEYLWYNAVLPMMMDYPDSRLIAAGTPKLTEGMGLLFKELWQRVSIGQAGYGGKRFTTYDNPHLSKDAIKATVNELHSETDKAQEIDGEFVSLDALGSFFKKKWFSPVSSVPEGQLIRGWDFAATPVTDASPDPDWTIGCALTIHEAGLCISDLVMLRAGPDEVDDLIAETAKRDPAGTIYVLPVDPASAGKVAFAHYKRLIETANPSIHVLEYPQTANKGSKAQRAKPVVEPAKNGEISYLEAPWNDFFFMQLAMFPNENSHDDCVDALSGAYNSLHLAQSHISAGLEES